MNAYLCLQQVRRIKKAVVALVLEMQALDWTSLAAPLDLLWVLHRVGDVVYLAKTLPKTSPAKEMVHAIKNAEKSVFCFDCLGLCPRGGPEICIHHAWMRLMVRPNMCLVCAM